MPTLELTCYVCDEAVTGDREAYCGSCGNAYHLNQRNDQNGADCGIVWINEEHLALEFGCNRCLNPEPETPPPSIDDVLDATEAAAIAGVSVAELTAAADAGRVAHRRTAGGIYLFTRRDVTDLAART